MCVRGCGEGVCERAAWEAGRANVQFRDGQQTQRCSAGAMFLIAQDTAQDNIAQGNRAETGL